jgi:hypothetical protein
MYSVDLWIEVWQLRMVLMAWGEEVRKMERVLDYDGVGGFAREGMMMGNRMGNVNGMETGARIRKRLGEIRAEYEVYVRECSMVIEGMALSAQLVSAHTVAVWVFRGMSDVVDANGFHSHGAKSGTGTRRRTSRLRAIRGRTRTRCGRLLSSPWCFFRPRSSL